MLTLKLWEVAAGAREAATEEAPEKPAVVHSRFSGTRVSRARAAMRARYLDRIGDRTIVREVLNVRVRCMMRMGDVAK
jgi:hypothetical protein